MQTLINSLVNGTTEYQDDGVIIQHPPNATMLRAARELANISAQEVVNINTIRALQFRVDEQLAYNIQLQEQLNEYLGTIAKLTTELQNLRNDVKQSGETITVDVGCASGDASTGDSDGEGRGTN